MSLAAVFLLTALVAILLDLRLEPPFGTCLHCGIAVEVGETECVACWYDTRPF